MSALEQEIIDRIRRMNEGQQRHILTLLDEVEGAQTIALGEALRQIDTLRLQLEAKYGADHFTSAVDILDEIRGKDWMTSWVVCDSGLMLATALPENMTPKARALLDAWSRTDIRLAAPKLYAYEIVAAIRKHVYRKSLTPEEGYQVRESLLSKTVELFMDDLLVKRGYDLATHFNRPTAYDSQYLAIAERLECDFWTADERLFNAVHSELSWVKWLGHFGEANNNQG